MQGSHLYISSPVGQLGQQKDEGPIFVYPGADIGQILQNILCSFGQIFGAGCQRDDVPVDSLKG